MFNMFKGCCGNRMNDGCMGREIIEPIKDLDFVITDEMKENLFEMIVIQQIIEKEELSKRERKNVRKIK